MAGPQFSSPPSVVPSKVTKRFTLEEANRTLPLVSRIVRDVVSAHAKATALQTRIEKGRARRGEEAELETTLDRLQEYVEELSGVGCEIKDCQMGLIDFMGRHQGRDVCLCWKLGEDKIDYWHEINSGFAGRQPVSALKETR